MNEKIQISEYSRGRNALRGSAACTACLRRACNA